MDDMTTSAKLRQLRHAIGKTQREFAAIVGVTRHTIESIEINRMKISAILAMRVQRACGVDADWLLGDGEEPMVNEYGQPWALTDFQECQERDEAMTFYLAAEEMQVAVAYDRLIRAYREARATHRVPWFIKALEGFVQAQVHQFPGLEMEIERENTERNRRQGKLQPYLFPDGVGPFKRARKKLGEAISTLSDWEERMALQRGIGEKVRKKRLENPDTSSANASTVTRTKRRQK
jgi:transcriptional regulator with XRE-family HTH domain